MTQKPVAFCLPFCRGLECSAESVVSPFSGLTGQTVTRPASVTSPLNNSERPKPLFWFRPDTETETVIGRYFRPIPKPILKPLKIRYNSFP